MNRARILWFPTLLLAALIFWGCDQAVPEPENVPEGPAPAVSQTAKQSANSQNAALKKLAASLAIAMDNQDIRVALENEFEQRYTGAPEVLYQWIKDKKISGGPSLQQHLAQAHAQFRRNFKGKPTSAQEALRDVRKYVARIPKLHFAMPLHLDEWNAKSEAPLVSYMPVDKDEKVQESFKVEAFDSSGKSHLLKVDLKNIYNASTGEPVDRPVVVLATNERTNADGEVLPAYASDSGTEVTPNTIEPCPDCGGGGGGGTCMGATSPRESGDSEYIYAANVSKDHEYSYLEPAEISFRIFTHSGMMLRDTDYTDPEPQNEWHECKDDDGRDIVERLFTWYWDDYGDYLVVDWYEYDEAGQFTATFNYTFPDEASISVGYETNNDNDPMGRDVINKDDPPDLVYDARDIDWKTRW